jgi:hypothetical protein
MDIGLITAIILMSNSIYGKVKTGKIANNDELMNEIEKQGLYHFTSKENAKKIVESKEIHGTGGLESIATMGKKRTYFFAGLPSFDQMFYNLDRATTQYEMTAVKTHPDKEKIKQLKYRDNFDEAIVMEGDYDLKGEKQEIVSVVLDYKDGKAFYREKTFEELEKGYVPDRKVVNFLQYKKSVKGRIKGQVDQMKLISKKTINNIKGSMKLYGTKEMDITFKDKNKEIDNFTDEHFTDDLKTGTEKGL